MSFRLHYEKKDLKLLRVPVAIFVISVLVACVLYFGSDTLNQDAGFDLSQAQAQYEDASTSVQTTASEEATIIRYIDRYKAIEARGFVSKEDRLAALDKIADLRSRYSLYPILVDIGEQGSLPLEYDPSTSNPGDPVNVNFSEISLVYSLVHEEDLTRMMEAFTTEFGLVIPQQCDITKSQSPELDFTQLGFNLQAKCSLYWFTFDLDPPEVVYEY